jgi:DNA-directed RNA polymerase specialized sigma subunit
MSSLPPALGQAFLAEWSLRFAAKSGNASSTAISALDHLRWARSIARRVRRAYNFRVGSQELSDLEQVACLAVVELLERFDESLVPAGGDAVRAFRGWAMIEVRNRCRREARRLRNGGTYNTRRETPGESLVVLLLPRGTEFVDPRSVRKDTSEEVETEETEE